MDLDVDDFDLLCVLALPGNARQCALVFLPFLSTEALRQVQVLFLEQDELLNPLHWLFARTELDKEAPRRIIETRIRIFLSIFCK